MTSETETGLPRSMAKMVFWASAVIALVWNGLGCVNFVQQLSPAGLATLPPEYLVLIENRPGWAIVAFALSVLGGLIGAILMLLRRRTAVIAFGVSLVGAIGSLVPAFQFGSTSVVIGTALSVVLAGLFMWISKRAL
jgi:hypothetical protein